MFDEVDEDAFLDAPFRGDEPERARAAAPGDAAANGALTDLGLDATPEQLPPPDDGAALAGSRGLGCSVDLLSIHRAAAAMALQLCGTVNEQGMNREAHVADMSASCCAVSPGSPEVLQASAVCMGEGLSTEPMEDKSWLLLQETCR